MNFTTTLSHEAFNSFMEALTIAGDYITDMEIIDGKIRQGNKLGNLILEMDISSSFDKSLNIPNSKNKLPIMKIISDDCDSVTIEMDETTEHACFIRSPKTTFKFNQSDSRLFDTHYKSDSEYQQILQNTSEANLLLAVPFEQKGLRRKIKQVTQAFSKKEIRVTISKNLSKFEIASGDKTQSCVVYSDEAGREMPSKYGILLPTDFLDCGCDIDTIRFYKPYNMSANPEDPNKLLGQALVKTVFSMKNGVKFALYQQCYAAEEKDDSEWEGKLPDETVIPKAVTATATQPMVAAPVVPVMVPEQKPSQPEFKPVAEASSVPAPVVEQPKPESKPQPAQDDAFNRVNIPGIDDDDFGIDI